MDKNIFQILICDEPASNDFKYSLKQKITDVYSNYNYNLYDNEAIRNFLYSFDKDILNAYDNLLPYAFKADLARYCLLYEFGGWYFDISVFPIFKYTTNKTGLVFFNTFFKILENSIMYFQSKHVLLEKTIRISVENINNKNYGTSPIDITGPLVLTSAFNSLGADSKRSIEYGLFNLADKNDISSNRRYDIKKKRFSNYKDYKNVSDISYLGLSGTNNYVDMWKEKSVYRQ
jgi:mannosyltransferase OCH1-like enzyme